VPTVFVTAFGVNVLSLTVIVVVARPNARAGIASRAAAVPISRYRLISTPFESVRSPCLGY
jgi:hypothetical protein